MEIIYVTVIGAALALILRYVLPKRETYGVALLPALGAAVTAGAWVSLTWLGLKPDAPWIWLISLVAPVVVALLTALLIPGRRAQSDAALFEKLATTTA
ncbi:hypothetical protein M2152_000607 [Microbacteriaceae bacterium SG_E_30_P1]|uniref:Integral membrane protein n=1 Tax=Antiquaquibacter oligotrophicus TaxID=2880260 RepID=A0ABT6KKC9_9MICO|nr:hypothetical protein [Antiquaquibacter oligotrophicus]MDH6180425.1 hypothetical protein [Antiquaquibacter oligotrophicus]UDF13837.1 hypothetical protein LH407_02990 [Antiquaquibacter oligotrophicus]